MITQVNRKLRENEDLQVIEQQESQVKAKIVDLKDRRKRFADCNVQGTLAARKINMDRILQLF